MKHYYFNKFEQRQPYQPIPDSKFRTRLFQFSAIITAILGIAYLHWRWMYSLNPDALWFAVPLVCAESFSFIGTLLLIFNLWENKDPQKAPPVHFLSEIENLHGRPDRPLRIDVFIASYNEDVEMVRYSIRDAKAMTYPYKDVQLKIYVLDDGKRDGRSPAKENMKQVAEEEGVGYFSRESNEGYKAGNLKNGMEQTNGDLFVILDADTRPFPSFLENTMGYFRNKKLAWVQTPQWFYDTTEPVKLKLFLENKIRKSNSVIKKTALALFGNIKIEGDIFGNDPQLFYDVLLRRRNYYNAAFCCGAGSIHRREALMSLAVRDFVKDVKNQINEIKSNNTEIWFVRKLKEYKKNVFLERQLIPFKFHASEDIYTSIMLHSDKKNRWQSIQHPYVECKMLSPQDLDSSIKQRTRYASGSLDIAFKDNPVLKSGLTMGQRICYFNTIWSYFAPLWISIFLLSPVVFFFTLAIPVKAYSFDFFKFFIPFQIMNTVIITIGCWGIPAKRGDQYYISSFWLMLSSLFSAIMGKKVKFNVTPKNKHLGNNLQHVLPHLFIIGMTIAGIIYNSVLVIYDVHPSLSGFVSNSLWGIFNIYNFSAIILAAYWSDES